MTQVRFRIELSENAWITAVSRAFPEATLRMRGVITDDNLGFALLAVAGERQEAVVEALRAHNGVDDAEVVTIGARETTVHVAGDTPQFVSAARRSGLPVEPPVEVTDGEAVVKIAGDRDRLSLLTEQFAEAEMTFDVERVGVRTDEPGRILTDTQRELVTAALDAGYYDTPRTCTLTELAERRGIAKSTCSETLQRAEEQLIKRSADRFIGADVSTAVDDPGVIVR